MCANKYACIQAGIFQDFKVQEGPATFLINLTVLLDYLFIFGSCPVSVRGLREVFSELDMTSEVLQITMSPEKPYFRLSTFGNAESSHLDYPKDPDLMESCNGNETQVNRSKISLLKPFTKALVLLCKVPVWTDNRGFLSLQ